MRIFFCDPFGHTDSDHLFNLGSDDTAETGYVYMHDQEPVHLDLHADLFQDVVRRNSDIGYNKKTRSRDHEPQAHVIVSERGQQVRLLCQKYGWTSHYYFFHGWACLDWFRGYDRTFMIAPARDRYPTRTFMSPNRIVAGKRDHRVLFLYNIFRLGLAHNHISAPRTCAYEKIDILTVANKYCSTYPDIVQVLEQANLPKLFAGEEHAPMTSCWLGNWTEAADSLVYVPTETVFFGDRLHLTEKTFKAIALEMPFVLVAPAGSLAYLREYGFRTFDHVWDESYDIETNDVARIEAVTGLLKQLDSLSVAERQAIHRACLPVIEHNYQHFYHGGFESALWQELMLMLSEFPGQHKPAVNTA